eukprot:TRINITY_DN26364_c1_g1_i2.p1 TRINITY_DN26364_c1_g1~~TRINITY_DN26364_c1_g1_i2.p1  ORF type:complete len:146 (-),score=17.17 TRINITY_DN26364_c1_g1_i2:28-465(-)
MIFYSGSRCDIAAMNTTCSVDSVCVVHGPPVHSQALAALCMIYAALSLRRILLSHDVESNPDPLYSEGDKPCEDGNTPAAEPTLSTSEGHITPDMAQLILLAIDRQSKQHSEETNRIRSDLSDIKSELGHVSLKCDQINERCVIG